MEENKCNKIPFSSKEEAERELKRILTTQKRPWAKRDTKPCRVYLCNHCSTSEKEVWHLTSKSTTITY